MKKENTALYILRLTVTLLLICAAVALALAGVNAITKDKIAAIKAEKTQKAIAAVLPGSAQVEEVPFTDASGRLMALKPDVTMSIVKKYAAGDSESEAALQ